jgi:hypothetical protein
MRILVAVLLLASATLAQAPPASLTPTEVQSLRLQVKQKDAIIARQQFADAQQNFQNAIAAMNAEADKIKKENKWDDKVVFNPDQLTFTAPPATPPPAAPPTPTPAKKP